MALFKFTKAILADEPIQLFNYGQHVRDFTFIDDIVEGLIRILDRPACANPNWDSDLPDPSTSNAPFRIYNLGKSNPVKLIDYIGAIELATGRIAKKELLAAQLGDVLETFADITEVTEQFDYQPRTGVRDGVQQFVAWYREYYQV
jgi:UDP-glucuronate 4-epimerase